MVEPCAPNTYARRYSALEQADEPAFASMAPRVRMWLAVTRRPPTSVLIQDAGAHWNRMDWEE